MKQETEISDIHWARLFQRDAINWGAKVIHPKGRKKLTADQLAKKMERQRNRRRLKRVTESLVLKKAKVDRK